MNKRKTKKVICLRLLFQIVHPKQRYVEIENNLFSFDTFDFKMLTPLSAPN